MEIDAAAYGFGEARMAIYGLDDPGSRLGGRGGVRTDLAAKRMTSGEATNRLDALIHAAIGAATARYPEQAARLEHGFAIHRSW